MQSDDSILFLFNVVIYYIMNILLLLTSYFIGAIPFGLLIGKFAGKDVRTEEVKTLVRLMSVEF